MRRPVLTLVLLASVTFFLGLGRQAITDGDEAYYAEAAREMATSGDWLTPHFNSEYRWEKPILYYWLTAAVFEVTGPSEAAARFWAALSGIGLVLLTFAIAREAGASDRAAWLAGAITATCFGYFAEARLALPDLPLTFLVTLAIWTALRQQWPIAGLAAGLAFLMKGPVGVVVPAIVLVPIWWQERGTRRTDWRGVGVGAVIFMFVGLPWYIAMTLTHGRAYLESFFLGDNLERFATNRFAGRTSSSWWFYGPILLGGLIPWTPFAVTLLIARVFGSRSSERRWRFSGEEGRLLLWALMPLLFFTVSFGKQPRYILPVLPPLAILLAASIQRRAGANDSQRALTAGTLLTVTLFAITGALMIRAQPLFITSYAPVTTFAIASLFAWAAALAALAIRKRWSHLPVAMTAAAATFLLALQFGALAGARPEPVERMAQMIRAYRTGSEPVGEYQVFVRNQVFYSGFRQQKDLDDTTAPAFLKSADRVFLVARESRLDDLRAAGAPFRELGRVDYIDTANVKLRTLLWPDPQRDIETIVLVTNK